MMMLKFDPLRFIADHAGMALAEAIAEAYKQGQRDAQPEIIRCKNCRYWKQLKSHTTKGICNAWYGKERSSTDYCSEGRRKEGEADAVD